PPEVRPQDPPGPFGRPPPAAPAPARLWPNGARLGFARNPFLAAGTGGDLRRYLRAGDEVFQTYETKWRGIEAMLPTLQLLDLTAYGRQETWRDSPAGWPQVKAGSWWRRDGRPIAQWTRTEEAVK